MSGNWAIRLDEADGALASRLRRTSRVEICVEQGSVWLRGPLDDALAGEIQGLPSGERFHLLDDGQLIPWGGRVPRGTLPAGKWQPLSGWFDLLLPLAALPGSCQGEVLLERVRDTSEREPTLMLTDLAAWQAYAITAPQVRLDRWMFAVDSQHRVLVRGTPLPPLAGVRLVEDRGIVVPAGWWWSPSVDAAVLRRWLALEEGDLALWTDDGSWERITGGDFTRATRAAIRHTAATM